MLNMILILLLLLIRLRHPFLLQCEQIMLLGGTISGHNPAEEIQTDVCPECGGRGGRHVEAKTPTGRLSPAQREAHAALLAAGYAVVVVRSEREGIEAVTNYLEGGPR